VKNDEHFKGSGHSLRAYPQAQQGGPARSAGDYSNQSENRRYRLLSEIGPADDVSDSGWSPIKHFLVA
jgi:hypothetical protein